VTLTFEFYVDRVTVGQHVRYMSKIFRSSRPDT